MTEQPLYPPEVVKSIDARPPMRRAGILERARKALGIDDLFERLAR